MLCLNTMKVLCVVVVNKRQVTGQDLVLQCCHTDAGQQLFSEHGARGRPGRYSDAGESGCEHPLRRHGQVCVAGVSICIVLCTLCSAQLEYTIERLDLSVYKFGYSLQLAPPLRIIIVVGVSGIPHHTLALSLCRAVSVWKGTYVQVSPLRTSDYCLACLNFQTARLA
jgi:hypothetical protein